MLPQSAVPGQSPDLGEPSVIHFSRLVQDANENEILSFCEHHGKVIRHIFIAATVNRDRVAMVIEIHLRTDFSIFSELGKKQTFCTSKTQITRSTHQFSERDVLLRNIPLGTNSEVVSSLFVPLSISELHLYPFPRKDPICLNARMVMGSKEDKQRALGLDGLLSIGEVPIPVKESLTFDPHQFRRNRLARYSRNRTQIKANPIYVPFIPPVIDTPFEEEITRLVSSPSFSLTEKNRANMEAVRLALEDRIRPHVPKMERVALFGSGLSTVITAGSDLDFSILLTSKQADTGKILASLSEILNTEPFSLLEQRLSPKMTVQILKCTTTLPVWEEEDGTTKTQKVEFDVCVENRLGILNSRLIQTYCACDERVRPFLLVLKKYTKLRNLSDASQGTLSSYGWNLLGLSFLQTIRPPVIPNLQSDSYISLSTPDLVVNVGGRTEGVMFSTDLSPWLSRAPNVLPNPNDPSFSTSPRVQNTQTVAQLFASFICFAASVDTVSVGFSIRHGGCISNHVLGRHVKRKGREGWFRILDPFENGRNVGAVAREQKRIDTDLIGTANLIAANSGFVAMVTKRFPPALRVRTTEKEDAKTNFESGTLFEFGNLSKTETEDSIRAVLTPLPVESVVFSQPSTTTQNKSAFAVCPTVLFSRGEETIRRINGRPVRITNRRLPAKIELQLNKKRISVCIGRREKEAPDELAASETEVNRVQAVVDQLLADDSLRCRDVIVADGMTSVLVNVKNMNHFDRIVESIMNLSSEHTQVDVHHTFNLIGADKLRRVEGTTGNEMRNGSDEMGSSEEESEEGEGESEETESSLSQQDTHKE
ncbi:putative pap 25a associated domain family protein [Blattamonas nauphoetae]|uniref:Pap 25a associated domain family protein n=1 Tax=Blattamonas nauphoetae TaxID=2049346 RepID=A0ABQ9YCN7_9EUKA|nr:putative pap 25a associated domain family protein [Blattamonas nauphoetae]